MDDRLFESQNVVVEVNFMSGDDVMCQFVFGGLALQSLDCMASFRLQGVNDQAAMLGWSLIDRPFPKLRRRLAKNENVLSS